MRDENGKGREPPRGFFRSFRLRNIPQWLITLRIQRLSQIPAEDTLQGRGQTRVQVDLSTFRADNAISSHSSSFFFGVIGLVKIPSSILP